MNKEKRYFELVKKVHECKCCESIKKPIFCSDGECLVNIKDEYKKEMKHINLWNYWQGDLNAKIMLIGQDFGKFPKTMDDFKREIEMDRWKKKIENGSVKTNVNLYYLFNEILEYDIKEKQKDLFFTNMACCYRQDKISGSENFCCEWLNICANKYMKELIDIIEPKIIIALGENVFNALHYVKGARLECVGKDTVSKEEYKENKKNSKKNNEETTSYYADVVSYEYELKREKKEAIRVFPVYHTGAYSNVNRTLKEKDANKKNQSQEADWIKIKLYKDSIR